MEFQRRLITIWNDWRESYNPEAYDSGFAYLGRTPCFPAPLRAFPCAMTCIGEGIVEHIEWISHFADRSPRAIGISYRIV